MPIAISTSPWDGQCSPHAFCHLNSEYGTTDARHALTASRSQSFSSPMALHKLRQSLQSSMIAPLRLLTLEPLQPHQPSERGCALVALKKVSEIRVVGNPDRTSECKFLLQVFSGQSRIPTASCRTLGEYRTKAGPCGKLPTASVAKELDDFDKLRNGVFDLAHDAHRDLSSCAFCQRIVDYTFWENHPPNALARLLFSDEKAVAASLSKFVGELVELVEEGCTPSSTERIVCTGRTQIPLVVHAFLSDAC